MSFFLLQTELRKVLVSKEEEMKRLLAGLGTGAVHTNSAATDVKKRKIENLDQVNIQLFLHNKYF